MGNNKKMAGKSRRNFLLTFVSGGKNATTEKVKLLTTDGKLVEVDKAVLDAVTNKQKATNLDICNWVKKPPKDKS